MMPGQKKTMGGDYHERRGGFMRAIDLLAFNTRLWLCDPLADCRKAGEGRCAAECEVAGISWVDYQWMVLQANPEEMRNPRMNLPPPTLDPQFRTPARFLRNTPATTPSLSSRPSPPSSDGGGNDGERRNDDMDNVAAPEKNPSGGGGGSRVRGCSGGGGGSHSGVSGSRGGWHRGGRERVRW